MTVSAQQGLRQRFLKEAPGPQRRKRVAIGGNIFTEGGSNTFDQIATQVILGFFGATDPRSEIGAAS
jgi:hypothetical protein